MFSLFLTPPFPPRVWTFCSVLLRFIQKARPAALYCDTEIQNWWLCLRKSEANRFQLQSRFHSLKTKTFERVQLSVLPMEAVSSWNFLRPGLFNLRLC